MSIRTSEKPTLLPTSCLWYFPVHLGHSFPIGQRHFSSCVETNKVCGSELAFRLLFGTYPIQVCECMSSQAVCAAPPWFRPRGSVILEVRSLKSVSV